MSRVSDKTSLLSPLKRALLALEEMQARLDALERSQSEPIAIVGMACRFPGNANDPEAFWRILRDGIDAITEVPSDRWDVDAYYDPDPEHPGKMYTRHGGFLREIDRFDPQLFGISPREALAMDPQQRLLLEVSWEALENAGQLEDRLAGSQSGVFLGITSNDYGPLEPPVRRVFPDRSLPHHGQRSQCSRRTVVVHVWVPWPLHGNRYSLFIFSGGRASGLPESVEWRVQPGPRRRRKPYPFARGYNRVIEGARVIARRPLQSL